jgi:hypothetical protein
VGVRKRVGVGKTVGVDVTKTAWVGAGSGVPGGKAKVGVATRPPVEGVGDIRLG